jgi:hypothetical protein
VNVLVGCEYSGIVRDAFLNHGHYALSCDLLPTESVRERGDHWHGDIFQCLENTRKWDLIVLHPPCTALAVSGNRWYGKGMVNHQLRKEALVWTHALWQTARDRAKYVAMENPVGVLNSIMGFPPQYIQPWEYGHQEFKKTGLWLSPDLPDLQPTRIITPPDPIRDQEEYRAWQKVWNMPPSLDRGKIRSRFFTGVADAMAKQWGGLPVDTL